MLLDAKLLVTCDMGSSTEKQRDTKVADALHDKPHMFLYRQLLATPRKAATSVVNVIMAVMQSRAACEACKDSPSE